MRQFATPYFFVLCLLAPFGAVFCQNVRALPHFTVRHFSGQDGLPDNKVRFMFRHPNGFLWAAANREVSRFDGYDFTPFAVKLSDIINIGVGTDGKILLLHEGATQFLTRIDPENGRRDTVLLDPSRNMSGKVQAILMQEAHVWAATQDNGGLRFYKIRPGDSPEQVAFLPGEKMGGLEPVNVLDFSVDGKNDLLWFTHERDGLCRLNLKTGERSIFNYFFNGKTRQKTPSRPELHLLNGQTPLVFSVSSPDLLIFDFSKNELRRLSSHPFLKSCFIAGADTLGNLLVKPNRDEHKNTWLFRHADQAWLDLGPALKNYSFNAGSGDDLTRQIWAITLEGLVQINFHPPLFRQWLPDDLADKNGIFECRGIASSPTTGRTLVLSEQYGLYETQDNRLVYKPFWVGEKRGRPFVPSGAVNLLSTTDDKIWLARSKPDSNLICLDLTTQLARTFDHPSKFSIKHFCRDEASGLFWLAVKMPDGNGAIYTFEPKSERFEPRVSPDNYVEMHGNDPWFLLRSHTGRFWYGGSKGLFLFDPTTARFLPVGKPEDAGYYRDYPVAALEEYGEDRLFIGTLGGGARVLDTRTGELKVLTINEGLAANKVAGIVPVGRDSAWASTWDGLSYFKIEPGLHTQYEMTSINFSVLDGLTHNECNRFSYYRSPAGEVFFGGLIGANSFSPDQIVRRFLPESDRVLLTHVSYFRPDGKTRLEIDTALATLAEVEIPAQNRACAFRFALADFWQPERNRFQYCLQKTGSGEPETWRYLGHNHEIAFNYLPSGQYLLRVRAANSLGIWSVQERQIRIVVGEFWYKTKAAFVLYAFVLGLGVLVFDRIQRRQQRLQLARKQLELEREQRHAQHLEALNAAFGRFVPHDFLRRLGYKSVLDTRLGDQIKTRMTILFADIRDWTALSEKMDPKANFNFINAYLNRVGPVIREHQGFVNQYFGDGIMALFPEKPDDALRAAIAMQRAVAAFNKHSESQNFPAIRVGIGLHTGSLMLGVLGDHERYDTGVISDAVNTAARVEGLTKIFSTSILVSEATLREANRAGDFATRFLGKIQVKGKEQALGVFEVFDGDEHEILLKKQAGAPWFEKALEHYFNRNFEEAARCFREAIRLHPEDAVALRYVARCERFLRESPENEWTGVEMMEQK